MSQTPSDFAQISGFYGPGTWAAWVITLITSWIPILLSDHKHNLHYLAYALYTNWATVDLKLQTTQASQHEKDFGEVDPAQLQNIIAARSVVDIGILHAMVQYAVCLVQLAILSPCPKSDDSESPSSTDDESKRHIKRRLLCITAGLVYPIMINFDATLLFHHLSIDSYKSGYQSFTRTSLLGIPVYFHGPGSLHRPFSFRRIDGSWNNPFFPTITLLTLSIIALFSAIIIKASTRSDATLKKRCSVVPCAPQEIGELDQSFSLTIALFAFFYEYSSEIIFVTRRSARRATKWLMPFLFKENSIFPVFF